MIFGLYIELYNQYPFFVFIDVYFQLNKYDNQVVQWKNRAAENIFQINEDNIALSRQIHSSIQKTCAKLKMDILTTSLEEGLNMILEDANQLDVPSNWWETFLDTLTRIIYIVNDAKHWQMCKDIENGKFKLCDERSLYNYLLGWMSEKFK